MCECTLNKALDLNRALETNVIKITIDADKPTFCSQVEIISKAHQDRGWKKETATKRHFAETFTAIGNKASGFCARGRRNL